MMRHISPKANPRIAMAFALVLAASVVSGRAAEPTKRALLVGINDYNAPIRDGRAKLGSSGRVIPDLQACTNDVVAMRAALTAHWGFKVVDRDVLVDQQASRKAIMDALDRLATESGPGDVVFFYYSGHGSRIENPDSDEQDKMDETLVPADAVLGVNDIRDKELAVKFNAILAAITSSGNLTVILDSCHSGSGTRDPELGSWNKQASPGKWVGPIPKGPAAAPWENGALVISAARDDEEALEDRRRQPYRGAFSGALMDVMNEKQTSLTAQELVELTRARMKVNRKFTQEPTLEALDARKKKGLFGEVAGDFKGVRVPVAMGEKDEVRISGGLALQIRQGCQLSKILADGKKLVVEVLEGATLSDSTGKIVQGTAADLKPGEYLEVTRWTSSDEPFLRVWAPPAVSEADVNTLAAQLSAGRAVGAFEWADDLSLTPVTHVLNARGRVWAITALATGQESLVGSDFSGATRAAPTSGKPRVLAMLPPTKELIDQIGLGRPGESDVVVWVSTPAEADYYLVGRLNGDHIEYCWALPPTRAPGLKDTSLEEQQEVAGTVLNTLPDSTKWFSTAQAGELGDYALRLGRIRSWLTLQAPPDEKRFPYRLALQRIGDDQLVTSGEVFEDERFRLALYADAAAIRAADLKEQRHVYVFAINKVGDGVLLFPAVSGGENRYPIRSGGPQDPLDFTPVIVLPRPSDIIIEEPFGIDTIILLTTTSPINADLLSFDGVRKGIESPRGDALSQLLTQQSSAGRARSMTGAIVPTGWSIFRLVVESRKKGAQR